MASWIEINIREERAPQNYALEESSLVRSNVEQSFAALRAAIRERKYIMTEGVNLAAIEEIRLLKARYLRALDTKDWPLLRSLLTDDMVGDFREMPGGQPDEKLLTTGADAFVAGVAAELDEATTVHHVHSFEIRFTGARDAEGIWAMDDHFWAGEGSDLAGRSRHGFGHYHDCYRKASGRWLIAKTRLSRIRVVRD